MAANGTNERLLRNETAPVIFGITIAVLNEKLASVAP
jgi:hypothetical protein